VGGALFASAFLLFCCQPMVGKMLLPYFGGAAAVWTTCILFFQTMLLAGYVYAHLLGRLADVRAQIATHALVLLSPFAFLPFKLTAISFGHSDNPSGYLFLQLLVSAGVPFFVVSTTAPLLQNWFARAEHASAHDPYFLYSASNTGSLLALLSYPFIIEPRLGVSAQNRWWAAGYIGLVIMVAITAGVTWNRRAPVTFADEHALRRNPEWKTRLYWIAAAFVPSGLMMAVTSHIAANLASAPFLWIVPLAIYLLTFVLAFAHRFRASTTRVSRLIPVVLLGIFPLVGAGVVAPPGLNWIVIIAHLLVLFVGALLCHTALANRRPNPQHLTEYYLWIAVGGVLAGVFTAIVAPSLFNTVFEYPLLVALLPLFRSGQKDRFHWSLIGAFALAVLSAWMIFRWTDLDLNSELLALVHTAFIFAAFKMKNQIRQFAAVFLILMMAYTAVLPGYIEGANRIYVGRNFFGVKKVLDDRDTRLRKFLHGDTIHGIESTDPARTGQPLSYYYPNGNVDQVVQMLRSRKERQNLGILGLGAGTMAAYGNQTTRVTFYEIDPSVEPIARHFFTFLPRCGTNCDLVIGDGRLRIADAADGAYDFLLLDAFSSDSVPAHLLSREAVQLYLTKLAADGVLVFHVSNRYLDIEQLVAALVSDAKLVAFSRFDDAGDLRNEGKSSSSHVVAARRLEDINTIPQQPGWKRLDPPAKLQPWTDDYSNLLALIRWH
jgi:hypothetical protein